MVGVLEGAFATVGQGTALRKLSGAMVLASWTPPLVGVGRSLPRKLLQLARSTAQAVAACTVGVIQRAGWTCRRPTVGSALSRRLVSFCCCFFVLAAPWDYCPTEETDYLCAVFCLSFFWFFLLFFYVSRPGVIAGLLWSVFAEVMRGASALTARTCQAVSARTRRRVWRGRVGAPELQRSGLVLLRLSLCLGVFVLSRPQRGRFPARGYGTLACVRLGHLRGL